MNTKSRVPALDRCLKILELLQEKHSCSVSAVVENTGLPRSSVYVLVDEMCKLGLIRQNSDGTLQLWMKLVSLGNSACENLDLRDVVGPHLESLMETVDCLAVHYGIMDGEHAYYAIKKVSPRAAMRIMSREGMTVSLVHAGLGKCLLAFQETSLRGRIINSLDYTPATETSIKTPDELRQELAKIRLQKWAFDDSEGEAEIRCVAAPVFDKENNLLGAISIVGTLNRFANDKIPAIVEMVKQCSQNITLSLN